MENKYYSLMLPAITTKEISGRCIPTIPAGTGFFIITEIPDYSHSTCRGLPVSSVWMWEYELLPLEDAVL